MRFARRICWRFGVAPAQSASRARIAGPRLESGKPVEIHADRPRSSSRAILPPSTVNQTDIPVVDLRSDTVTAPDAKMREVMASAAVGDHVLGDDPTAAELERFAANLLGKEAALFFPSGIMANQAAILVQTSPGMEIVLDADSHILNFEEGAASAWAGVQARPVRSDDGLPDPERFAEAIGTPSRFLPVRGLVCLENTHNSAGGRVVPVDRMAAVVAVARERGVPVHLDGARLPNAEVAEGVPMREWAALADTVMVSLSKGLGAPIGSVLAGSAELMDRATRVRRRLGGGMRQVGILAAAGLHALRHNFSGIAYDHARAAAFARRIGDVPGLAVTVPDSNIVMIQVDSGATTTESIISGLEAEGILTTRFGPSRIRTIFHRDVDDAGLERAVEALNRVASEAAGVVGQVR
jgi:threonine aldolase